MFNKKEKFIRLIEKRLSSNTVEELDKLPDSILV